MIPAHHRNLPTSTLKATYFTFALVSCMAAASSSWAFSASLVTLRSCSCTSHSSLKQQGTFLTQLSSTQRSLLWQSQTGGLYAIMQGSLSPTQSSHCRSETQLGDLLFPCTHVAPTTRFCSPLPMNLQHATERRWLWYYLALRGCSESVRRLKCGPCSSASNHNTVFLLLWEED